MSAAVTRVSTDGGKTWAPARRPRLRALTLWPEWALCVSDYDKRIENRTWPPPRPAIRQPLAIHGGMRIGGPKVGLSNWRARRAAVLQMVSMVHGAGMAHLLPARSSAAELVELAQRQAAGQIVAVAGSLSGFLYEREPRGYYIGFQVGERDVRAYYGWQLDDVVKLHYPVPAIGRQGLWDLTQEQLLAVLYALPLAARLRLGDKLGFSFPAPVVGSVVEVECSPGQWMPAIVDKVAPPQLPAASSVPSISTRWGLVEPARVRKGP